MAAIAAPARMCAACNSATRLWACLAFFQTETADTPITSSSAAKPTASRTDFRTRIYYKYPLQVSACLPGVRAINRTLRHFRKGSGGFRDVVGHGGENTLKT